MRLTKKLTFAALCVVPLVALAQPGHRHGGFGHSFDQRQTHQQQRIDQGLRSGALTQHEAQRLQRGQQHLQGMENRARADGHISGHERWQLDRAADRQSQWISREKHDRQHDYNHNGRVDGWGRGNGGGWNNGNHYGWNNGRYQSSHGGWHDGYQRAQYGYRGGW